MSKKNFRVDKGLTFKPIDKSTITDLQVNDIVNDSVTGELVKYNGVSWEDLGGSGSQSLNTLTQLYADNDSAWSKRSGSDASVFSISTTNPLSGTSSYEITFASTTTDTFQSEEIDVPIMFRGNSVSLEMIYSYSTGVDKSAGISILDVTNNTLLLDATTDTLARFPLASTATVLLQTFTVPVTCEKIRVLVGASGAGSASGVLKFDNIELKLNVQNIAITEGPKSHIRFGNGGNRGSTNTQVVYFTDLAEKNGSGLSYVSNSTVGTLIYAERSGILDVSMTRNQPVSATGMQIVKNISAWSASNTSVNVIAGYNGSSGAGVQGQMSGKTRVVKGDYVCIVAETNTSNANTANTFSAVLHEDNLAARYADYTLNQDVSFQGYVSATQSLTANTTNINLTSLKDTTGAWTGSTFVVPSAGDYEINGFLIQTNTSMGIWYSAYVNGVEQCRVGYSAGLSTITLTGVARDLKAGDILSIRANTATTMSINAVSHLSIHKQATSQQLFTPIAQRYVVKTYQSGTSWYEVYNDGWVKQAGVVNNGSAVTDWNTTVTYLIPIVTATVPITQSARASGGSALKNNQSFIYSFSNTGFSAGMFGDGSSQYMGWEVSGYGNAAAVRALGANPAYS